MTPHTLITPRVQWNPVSALPYDQTLDQVLYNIRRTDAGEGLLLDAVRACDIAEDADEEDTGGPLSTLAFDALVTPYAQLERKMQLLQGVMDRASTSGMVKPVALQITEPFKQRGVANVAAIFELSDGQTVSIYLHNPDTTPAKMAPGDELISWKWLLNKKDITIVVAPERGEDINVREVARRIIKLAEKNSAAFQRANGKRAERMQAIEGLKTEITGLEGALAAAQQALDVAKMQVEEKAASNKPSAQQTPAQAAIKLVANSSDPQTERALIDAYVAAYETDSNKVNAAVAAVNWQGAIDTVSSMAELKKLEAAVASARDKNTAYKALEEAGINYSQLTIPDNSHAQERDAFFAQREAIKKLREIANTHFKAEGKAKFAALAADAPVEDYARAIYQKNGVFIALEDSLGTNVIAALNAKDTTFLRDVMGNTANKSSREIFERFSGFKLASSKAGTFKQIDAWAGITPEQRAAKDAERDAAGSADALKKDIQWAWNVCKSGYVRDAAGAVENGQDFLIRSFEEGVSTIDLSKRGAATVYGLSNSDKSKGFTVTKSKWFGAFLKLALQLGGLDKALELVGAVVPKVPTEPGIELTGKELGDFADTAEGYSMLQKAALAHFEEHLIGQSVFNASLSADVAIRKSGTKKIARPGSSRLKLKLVPATLQLIKSAKKQSSKPTTDAGERNVKAYHYMKAEASVDNEKAMVWMVVKEDDKGAFFYEEFINKNALSGIAGVAPALDSTGLDGPALGQGTKQTTARSTVNTVNTGDDFQFDENEMGQTFELESLALDSVSGGSAMAMVFNLFIEGEALESQDETSIAAVDAAYRFASATDDFKQWVAGSVGQDDYSPFASAKTLDEAAKQHGAGIEWGKWGGSATLDAVNGIALDAVGDAMVVLQNALDIVKTNEPINRMEGNIAQADLQEQIGESIMEALGILAKTDAFQINIVLDGIDADGYVGKIKKGGKIVGRVDMDGDGKALVYVGAKGDDQVVSVDGSQSFFYSDNEKLLQNMMAALLAKAPEVTTAKAFLQTVIDGKHDMLEDSFYQKLEDAANAVGGEGALVEQAVDVYSNFMIKTAQEALATA